LAALALLGRVVFAGKKRTAQYLYPLWVVLRIL
jgi:hypothetical protein